MISAPHIEPVDQPEILDLADEADLRRFKGLTHAAERSLEIIDSIDRQLRELVKTTHPRGNLSELGIRAEIDRVLGGVPPQKFGRWVHYPWLNRLVHVLPPEHFAAVRRDRNQYKITLDEARRLHGFTIGIVGLSVGSAVARTLSLEGVGGFLKVADFDSLDLSNLNRLQAGVADIGTNKAVLCARQIYELDPYAQIEIFAEGLTGKNLSDFLVGPPRLDLIIDECDSLDMKIVLREAARSNRIPVLMQTSDNGMLDVERFDLEPSRPILHGRVGNLRSSELAGLSNEQKVQHVLRILAPEELSARAAASMVEIERTISTWPQLASDVQLGGALATIAARRLCLGQALESGRRYVDAERIVSAAAPAEQRVPTKARSRDNAGRKHVLAPNRRFAEMIVYYATMAPSGGNCQPWLFLCDGEDIVVARDCGLPEGCRDPGWLGSYLAIGAAIENAVIAARELGNGLDVTLFPQPGRPDVVARLSPPAAPTRTIRRSGQLMLLERRTTNRRLGNGKALDQVSAQALQSAAERDMVALDVVTSREAIDQVGRIVGGFDRLQFTVPALHAEVMSEIRWSPEEADRTRDGIDVATLELDPKDALALRLIARTDVASILRDPGKGQALEEPAVKAFRSSGAACLLRVNGRSPAAFVEAGRAMQRIWLRATKLGLGLQPWTGVTFAARMLDTRRVSIFSAEEETRLRRLSIEIDDVFREQSGWDAAMLFRVSQVPPPSARARRRPIEDVLRVTEPARETYA